MADAILSDVKSWQPFNGGQGIRVAVTDVSAATFIPGTQPGQSRKVLVQNYGDNPAFARLGQSGLQTTTAGIVIMPGIPYILSVPAGLLQEGVYIALICESGLTTTVNICAGDGS